MENKEIERIEIDASYTTKNGTEKTKTFKVTSLYNPDMDLISIRVHDGYKGSVYLPSDILEEISEALVNISIDKPKKTTSKKNKTSKKSDATEDNNPILDAIASMQQSMQDSNKQLQKQINVLKTRGKK